MRLMGRQILCALLALGAAHGAARGQAAPSEAQRFDRTLQQIQQNTLLEVNQGIPIDQRMTLDYGAYLSFAYTSLDDNNNNNHGLRQTDFYAFSRLNIDGAHEFFLRYHTGYRDFNKGDSFTGRGSEPIDGEIDRGYYRFDLSRYEAAYHGKQIQKNLVLEAGRDYVYWANGLVLANALDGGFLHGKLGPMNLDIVAGVTPVRTVDFDSSRPDFDFNTHRGFYGAMVTADVGAHHPFVYAMIQRDYNKKETLDTGPVVTHFDYNSVYVGIGSTGNFGDHWLYGVEFAHESGNGLSNSFMDNPTSPVPQTHDPIEAWAADLRIDYLLNDIRRSRLTGEVILASGEDDRFNNTSNTF